MKFMYNAPFESEDYALFALLFNFAFNLLILAATVWAVAAIIKGVFIT